MTVRKANTVRPYKPERASRETMAYLLDMSADTFDRLVSTGRLPAAQECAGIKRWNVDAVMKTWDGSSVPVTGQPEPEPDPLMKNLEVFRGKAEGRRGAA